MGLWPWTKRKRVEAAGQLMLVRARFDAAQTTPDNRKHWSNADALAADSADFTKEEAVPAALEKVFGYVQIGLERHSGGSLDKAAEILTSLSAKDVFRAGYSSDFARSPWHVWPFWPAEPWATSYAIWW